MQYVVRKKAILENCHEGLMHCILLLVRITILMVHYLNEAEKLVNVWFVKKINV